MQKESLSQRNRIEKNNLLPLQERNLALSVENYGEMETDLGLRVTNTILDDEMKYAMKVRLRKVREDKENYLWLTNWAVVLNNTIIGGVKSGNYSYYSLGVITKANDMGTAKIHT